MAKKDALTSEDSSDIVTDECFSTSEGEKQDC